MERIYTNRKAAETGLGYFIENQLEFICGDPEYYKDENYFIASLSKQEYENLINDIIEDIMDDTTLWEPFDDAVTAYLHNRISGN